MKLWELKPREGLDRKESPWEPWYDRTFGFIVRAETENEARQLANEYAGDENYKDVCPWLDSHYSVCVELRKEGIAMIVLRDFHSA